MDLKSVSQRLTQEGRAVLEAARAARLEAEAANADVDAMIDEVQHIRLGHQRMVFSIAGFDDDERSFIRDAAALSAHLAQKSAA
jgi:hypothetical protein